jgi:hypothetical protein
LLSVRLTLIFRPNLGQPFRVFTHFFCAAQGQPIAKFQGAIPPSESRRILERCKGKTPSTQPTSLKRKKTEVGKFVRKNLGMSGKTIL